MKRLILFLTVACLYGCGTTLLQRLDAAGAALDQMVPSVKDQWYKQCEELGKKCLSGGIEASKDCQPMKTCQEARLAFGIAINSTQAALSNGLILAAKKGDERKIGDYLTASLKFLDDARKIATQAGLFKALE